MKPENNEIEELKEKLKDYYGTALASGLWAAGIDLSEVDTMSDEEVRETARLYQIR